MQKWLFLHKKCFNITPDKGLFLDRFIKQPSFLFFMADNLLVIAGTHKREIGLAYGVLDSLDSRLNSQKKSQTEINHEGARAAVISYGNLVTARIILPNDNLRVSQSEGRFHWTPAHEGILNQVGPMFFIDIHSWHKYGQDAGNTGAYLKPHSEEWQAAEMRRLLELAQEENPKIYGKGRVPCLLDQEAQLRLNIKSKLMNELGLSERIKRVFSRNARRKLVDCSNSLTLRSIAKEWGNNWFILNNEATDNFKGYNCFTLEGIDEDKSKEPIADFIADYVLKNLSCFRKP